MLIIIGCSYSPTFTNGHLSTTTTFLSRRTVHILVPYIGSCSLRRQRPLKWVPNCQNNLSTTANLTLTIVHKRKKTNKLYYPGYDPTFLAISSHQMFHYLRGIKLQTSTFNHNFVGQHSFSYETSKCYKNM